MASTLFFLFTFVAAFTAAKDLNLPKGWFVTNANHGYSFKIEKSVLRHPQIKSYRFELHEDDKVFSVNTEVKKVYSCESTLTMPWRIRSGESRWYGFSFFIPKSSKTNHAGLLAAWQKVDPDNSGEIRAAYPVSLHYHKREFKVAINYDPDRHTSDGVRTPVRGTNIFESKKLPTDQWLDFVFEIKPSKSKNGLINGWIGKNKVITFTGSTGQDSVDSLRLGLIGYCSKQEAESVVYFSNIKFGSSFSEVDPSKP